MKIVPRGASGSVLVVIVMVIVLMGITLGSYLHLVANQNLSIMRSMAWNSAIAVAEAGIEEAMAHLNANTTNRASDGWVVDGTNVVKERLLGEAKYRVFISKDLEPPVILAEGYVKLPKGEDYMQPRKIRVTTTNDALFAKGVVAKGQIDLAGNNIKTDSFDSTDPNYSTDGRYDPAKNKDGGDVATNSSVVDSLNVWNANIYGKASTGPGGNVRLGQNGAVGSKEWHAAGKKGIEPGWSKDDMNVYFPDVKAPFSGGAYIPGPGTVDGVYYKYILDSGNYQLSDLKLSASEKVLVRGSAVLLVTREIDATGSSEIVIRPEANLQLYMAGQSAKFSGKGVVNESQQAGAFSYWGLPANTQLTMAGNASVVGTIYAPQAALTLGGGGSDTYDFVGAAVSNSVKINGHYNVHYDESLRIHGPRRSYTITLWNEESWWEEVM